MADTHWGFERNYAHRRLPTEWHNSSSYTLYSESPLLKKSFRRHEIPVNRSDLVPLDTNYGEREQTPRFCQSAYGCHREMPWDQSLRSPRNPCPGRDSREQRYVREDPPPYAGHTPGGAPTGKRVTIRGRRGLSLPHTSNMKQLPPVREPQRSEGSKQTLAATKMLLDVYDKYDANGDQTLTFAELERGIMDTGLSMSYMSRADKNGDGMVSKEEWLSFWDPIPDHEVSRVRAWLTGR